MSPINSDGCLLYVILLTLCLQDVLLVQITDFYPYEDGSIALKESFIHMDLAVPYPHWADPMNTKIDVVNSGIIRFSGLEGLNTLDLLVVANSLPLSENIFYKQEIPQEAMKAKLRNDLKDSRVSNWQEFNPLHMIICTWVNVPFYSNGATSSFQIVLTSNGNRTLAIIQVAKMDIPEILTFYPEMDLRFAYEDGTKFVRTGYLNITGVPTATKTTNIVTVTRTNSKLNGRWILDLSEVNITEEVQQAPTVPPNIPRSEFENSTDIGLSGQFVFNELFLDNSVLTTAGNNDEISVILAKKDSDTRYGKLTENIKVWVKEVYKKAANASGTTVDILGYKAGSLVVEYSVQVPNVQQVCADVSREECLQKVSTSVKEVSASEPIQTSDMRGTIDEKRTIVSDFNECTINNNGQYCDRNAYCLNFPGELSYGCKCKDGFQGNGFPGNCKKKKEEFLTKNLAIIGGSAGAGGFLVVLIIAIVCYVKRKEKTNWEFKRLAMQRALPKKLLPEDANNQKKGRSTRKVLIPAAYTGRDFDIYHRTSTS